MSKPKLTKRQKEALQVVGRGTVIFHKITKPRQRGSFYEFFCMDDTFNSATFDKLQDKGLINSVGMLGSFGSGNLEVVLTEEGQKLVS